MYCVCFYVVYGSIAEYGEYNTALNAGCTRHKRQAEPAEPALIAFNWLCHAVI
jgi:hypothetical protein